MRVVATDEIGPYCEVLLNGNPVRFCTVADTDKNYLVRFKINASGQPVLNRRRTEIETEKLRGHVQVFDLRRVAEGA